MIYSIRGKVLETQESFIVIEANGVGYLIHSPQSVISNVMKRDVEDETLVYTHHHIREDAQELYGFLTLSDKKFFQLLISISGVGPKVGIKILSAMSTDQFVQAILSSDLHTLVSLPGVGKKMAERMIVELKDKIPKIYDLTNMDIKSTTTLQNKDLPIYQDLSLALKTLGYSQDEIKRSLSRSSEFLHDSMNLEEGIKIVLKNW